MDLGYQLCRFSGIYIWSLHKDDIMIYDPTLTNDTEITTQAFSELYWIYIFNNW